MRDLQVVASPSLFYEHITGLDTSDARDLLAADPFGLRVGGVWCVAGSTGVLCLPCVRACV